MLFTHVPFHTVAAMQDYRQQCYWDTIAAPPDGTVLNMLRAGDSDRWDAPMIARLNEALDAAKMCTAQVNSCSFGLYARGAASSTKMRASVRAAWICHVKCCSLAFVYTYISA